jgi:hypothetical protein
VKPYLVTEKAISDKAKSGNHIWSLMNHDPVTKENESGLLMNPDSVAG